MTELGPSNERVSDDDYWINSYFSYGHGEHSRGVGVCVTMGKDCWKNFSGLRLIVAFNQTDFKTPPMVESIDPAISLPLSSPEIYQNTYRQQLQLHKSLQKNKPHPSSAYNLKQGAEYPVCNVLLLLSLERSVNVLFQGTLHSLQLYSFGQLEMEDQWQVLVDKTWPSASSPPVGSVTLLDLFPGFVRDGRQVIDTVVKPVYHLVVHPFKRNIPCPELPKSIVYSIAREALGPLQIDDSLRWRKQLLAYALVHRSWTHVLDIFFREFGGVPLQALVDPAKTARSLLARPERGSLIVELNLHNISPLYPLDEIIKAYKIILAAASCALTKVAVNLRIIRNLLDELAAIENVEIFALSAVPNELARPLSISNKEIAHMHRIQSFCSQWKKLKTLTINFWDDPLPDPDLESDSSYETFRNILNVPLSKLSLSNGVLCRDNLLAFGCTTLTTLILDSIKGIMNVDLTDFLNVIAPSLTSLTVAGCNFPREQGEAHAVERSLPSLQKLVHLNLIVESGISCGVIAGRTGAIELPPQSGLPFKTYGLSIQWMVLERIEALPQALERTAWEAISIAAAYGCDAWPVNLEQECRAIAKRRGINLEISTH